MHTTSFITIPTNTKINLKVNSKKTKLLFHQIKKCNSINTDTETFKFIVQNYVDMLSEIKKLKSEKLNLILIKSFHSCTCKQKENTSTSLIKCCNSCGKPKQKFWKNL